MSVDSGDFEGIIASALQEQLSDEESSIDGGGREVLVEDVEDEEERDAAYEKVEIELPPEMTRTATAVAVCTTGVDDKSSIASSFVPITKMGSLDIGSDKSVSGNNNNADDSSSTTSWSHVASVAGVESLPSGCACTSEMDVSSIVSRFEHLKVQLETKPFVLLDEQLARQMQENEDSGNTYNNNGKRKALPQELSFVMAQVLAADIVTYAKEYQGHGFVALTTNELVYLGARFIDCAQALGGKVTLAYTFTDKYGAVVSVIRKNGFGQDLRVSANPNVALAHGAFSVEQRYQQRPAWNRMAPIPEGSDAAVNHHDPDPSTVAVNECIGWIVAVAVGPAKEYCLEEETTSEATVMTLSSACQSMPLVCFDASQRNHGSIERLTQGLSKICDNFFQTDWSSLSLHDEGCTDSSSNSETVEADPSRSKRHKPCAHHSSGGDDDGELTNISKMFEIVVQTSSPPPSPVPVAPATATGSEDCKGDEIGATSVEGRKVDDNVEAASE